MPWNLNTTHSQPGDLALLVGLRHKHFIFPLLPGGSFHTHRGILYHDELIGRPWGSQVFSHTGSPFFLLQPPLSEMLRGKFRRVSQTKMIGCLNRLGRDLE